MMYFQLESDENAMTAYISPEDRPIRAPIRGQIANVAPAKLPYRFKYRDPFGHPLFDYYSGECLMSKRLIASLERVGVDNLQTFDAVLTSEDDGLINNDFCVVNIIGLVACANVGASTASELGSTYYFHDLVIDPTVVGDLLIFRLAESLMDVIVHEKVASELESEGFTGVVLRSLKTSA